MSLNQLVFVSFLAIVLLLGGLYSIANQRQRRVLHTAGCLVFFAIVGWFSVKNFQEERPPADSPVRSASSNPPPSSEGLLPSPNHEQGFVGAERCRECHKSQHQSWHATYHRTMTQAATPESVIPSFDDVTLSSRGRDYRLTRSGDEFWVDTVSPSAEMQAFIRGNATGSKLPIAHRRIVMTTGSHWHQTYWMQEPNGMLVQFPWVYHMETKRWVYRIDSFLSPPTNEVTFNIWNVHCIGCHSTGGEPRISAASRSMFSVGEPGISCEACHGPGGAHVASATANKPEESIVLPSSLGAKRSSQVCGQCHSASYIHDHDAWERSGNPYRPGNDQFDAVRKVYRNVEDMVVEDDRYGASVKTRFWPDGTVRTGGREYNGLIRSACHTEGSGDRQMSCVSCHSMHSYESTNKLMAKDKLGDRQCIQCHTEAQYTTDLSAHTHHDIGSGASRCVNCHMPHTSYALFNAIRSHRVQSPSVRAGRKGSRPNACNLCHLDQTKAWTAQHLKDWYDIESPTVEGEESEIAAGVLWALKGDAAQRAIMAWHFGWSPAQKASGNDWMIPLLSDLLTDTYSAVRYIAYESLRTYGGFEDLKYDFDGTTEKREEAAKRALGIWKAANSAAAPEGSDLTRLLLKAPRKRDRESVDRLLQEQDSTPISIVE